MIVLKNMTYSIPNNGLILSNVNFEINPGDFIGLLGKNGSGKTTLIELLMGFRCPDSGIVRVFDQDPALSDRGMFTKVAFLSQDIYLKDNISVEDFFNFHSHFYNSYSFGDQAILVKKFKIDLKAKIGGLSTGQKRRVQIVAAIASRPEILIVDEITAVLDPDARKIFFDLLNEMNLKQNTAIILATNIIEDLKGKIKSLLFVRDHNVEVCDPNKLDNLFVGDE